jgi:hypothetical protein
MPWKVLAWNLGVMWNSFSNKVSSSVASLSINDVGTIDLQLIPQSKSVPD